MSNKIELDTGTDLPNSFLLTQEFKSIFNTIENTKSNLFITGKAGCGKSTLLEYFRQNTKRPHAIVAPTGLTAIKARGMTIHKLFKLPPTFIRQEDVRFLKDKELLKKIQVLLIDECSMMRADVMDAIDESLRKNRAINKPFGGVQIVMFGDLLQLSPIVNENTEGSAVESIYPDGSYFFHSKVFHKAHFQIKELTKIFRQSDKSFIDLLNKFRVAKVDEKDLAAINTRYQGDDFSVPEGVILLSTTNAKVDRINNSKLAKLDTKLFEYEGGIKGDFKDSECPSPRNLKLKVGAQVMLTKNDIGREERRWSNGTLATIHELKANEIRIKIKDEVFTLGKNRWEKIQFTVSGSVISKKVSATFIQYPLKLAWAATIHKSQGQTFERVAIDLDKGAFAHGQVYVALSRAKSIEGIYLIRKVTFGDLIFDEKVFDFLDQDLEAKYLEEVKKNQVLENSSEHASSLPYDDDYNQESQEENKKISDDGWTEAQNKRLIMLYKKNLPESALANIFKKSTKEIRAKIMQALKG